MENLQRIQQGILAADKAGDSEGVKVLGTELRRLQQQDKPQEATLGHKVGATIDGAAQFLTFGFSDEIAAGLDSGFGFVGDYDKSLAEERARMEENKRLAGGYEIAGEIAGGLATGSGLMKAGLTFLPRAGKALSGAKSVLPKLSAGKAALAEGAAYGAAFGAGTAKEGERLEGAAIGGVIGGVTGGLINKAGNKIAEKLAGVKSGKFVPATEALQKRASELYDKADSFGVTIKGKALKKAAADMKLKLGGGKARKELFKESFSIVDFIDEAASDGQLSLREVDEVRQIIGDTIQGASRREKRFLIEIKNSLDYFIDNLTPSDVTGNIKDASRITKQAREIYSRFGKSEVVDAMIEKAMNQATGFENGLVVQFRQLANTPKQFKRFNKQEQAAILKVVRGGPIENTLRAFAWFSPQKTLGAIATGLTAAEHGIGPASVMSGVGMLATKSAEKARMGNAQALERIIKGVESAPALPNPLRRAIGPASGITSSLLVQQ